MDQQNLEKIREKIDQIDQQIVQNLADRFALVKELAPYKNPNSIEDKKREKQILSAVKKQAKSLNLNKKLVKIIFKKTIKYSNKYLKDILK